MTLGAVAIKLRSNSRWRRSWMISRCNRPRKPQRKPKPSAAEVSISKEKLASLRRNLPIAVRSVSKSSASTGNRPQNTTGMAGLKPGSMSFTGLRSSVMVSPTRGSPHFLDRRGDEADLARTEFVDLLHLRGEEADALDVIGRLRAHHADA